MTYPVPANQVEILYEIKKSKFIATACHASSRETALSQLAALKSKYPDARHHCWAYILGHPNSPTSAAADDDGEPSGTAGKPILNVLQHKNIGDILVVVTRYFGGIKLGAGGLVRAYSTATQQAIEQLIVKQEVNLLDVGITVDYQYEQYVRHLLEKADGEVSHCTYQNDVFMELKIPFNQLPNFEKSVSSIAKSLHLPGKY